VLQKRYTTKDMLTILFIAFGLAMDALAVSITSGLTIKDLRLCNAATIALFFGSFQTFMPLIGWLVGLSAREFITRFDHWIAFGLLNLIGCKIIFESTRIGSNEKEIDPLNIYVLLILAIATSIDALKLIWYKLYLTSTFSQTVNASDA